MPLDTVAARSRRRRLPSVDVPQVADDELRRSIEALKEHIRMYEGDSGAPKERFVTLEELELAGLIGTRVQGNFATINEVLGGDVAKGQQSGGQKIVFEGGSTVGGGGTDLLRDLLDTSVGGVKPGSVLYYENGVWSYVDIGKIDNEFEVAQTFYNCTTWSDIDATMSATLCLTEEYAYAPSATISKELTLTTSGLDGIGIRADVPFKIFQGNLADDVPLLTLGYDGENLQFRAIQFGEALGQSSIGAGSGFYIDYEGLLNSPDNELHFGSDKPSAAGTIFWIGERGEFRIEDNLNHGASLTSINHPFQIGPDNSSNLRMGRNEIQCVLNGGEGTLDIQPYGGDVRFFNLDSSNDYHYFYIYLGKQSTISGRFYLVGDSANLNTFMYFGSTSGNDLIWTAGFTTENLKLEGWDHVLFEEQRVRWTNWSGADYAEFFHDDTDFLTTFVQTGDWYISGLTGDVRISTDLKVDGTYIQYNSDAVDPPTEDVTLEVYRGGVAGTTAIRWNETTDRWEFTNDGTTYQNFVTSGEFLTAVVDDTAPQLGGQLDVNGNAIGDGTLELLTFTETASAVNHVNLTNAITAEGPTIGAAGDDTDIDLNLAAKGTGNIKIGNFTFDADQTVGAGEDNYILTYDNATGLISLEIATGGSGTDLTWTASTRTLASSTGTDAIITLFTSTDAGLAPASGGGTTNYLRADGTWAAPAGGSASNSFETHTVTDTDSGFTWAETGSAVADSTTDTLTWVSGTGIDIDVDATSDAIRIANTGIVTGADLVLDDISDVTETTITTGDLLRWNGTAWVNYADSNYAASGHTHTLSEGATDVTATAAELNLLDLSGLTAGWALIADSATTASWQAITESDISDLQSYLLNVVEDTAPQLGGMLDVNGQAIGDGTLELLTFTETASAVNHLNITNAITANGPTLGAAGDDANIDLILAAKGTGNITLGSFSFDADQTVGAGQDNYVLTYDDALGTIQLEEAPGLSAGTTTNSTLRWNGTDWVENTSLQTTAGSIFLAERITPATSQSGYGQFYCYQVSPTRPRWQNDIGDVHNIVLAGNKLSADSYIYSYSISASVPPYYARQNGGGPYFRGFDNGFDTAVDGTTKVELGPDGNILMTGTLKMLERSAAKADTAAYGQIWVKDDVPNSLWFTDDAGNDHSLDTTNLTWTASTRTIASDTGTDAVITLFTSTDAGLTPASGGGTTNYLRADGTWAAPPGGGGISNVVEDTTPQLGGPLDVVSEHLFTSAVADTISIYDDLAGTTEYHRFYTDGSGYFMFGGTHRIYAPASVLDYTSMSHDGAIFTMAHTSTTDFDITGLTADVRIRDGAGLKIQNSTDTGYVRQQLNVADFEITSNSAVDWIWKGFTDIRIEDGATFEIWDSGDTDSAQFQHDGTDFTTTFINTAEWEISGTSQIRLLQDNAELVLQSTTQNIADSAQVTFLEGVGTQIFGSTGYGFRWTLDGVNNDMILKSGNLTTVTDRIKVGRDSGDISLGNFRFNTAQSVGAGQDNYVLTYDDGTGDITLEVLPTQATNLTWTASTRTVASDTGTDAVISLFTSADAGLTPASGGGTTNYLRADGTWAAPPGGSASNSFETQTVTDTDSGYTWTATGSAVADSSTDTLTWVSGTGINIDVDAGSDAIRVTNTGIVTGADLVLDDISDVTETTITTGDVLRWNGTAWVNYADSNFAAASHTHTLTDVTDVTATAAEVNLLDLSGLTAGWALIADSATTASWQAITESDISDLQSYLLNVVQDTTPQLGGMLDVNGQALGDGTLELLTFTETASAVNHLNITNAITANGPTLSAAGDDVDVDLNLAAKGAGNISLGNFSFDADQTVGAGQDNYVLTYDNAGGLISLEQVNGTVPDGTTTNAVLRWNGSAWVEETEARVGTAGIQHYSGSFYVEINHDGSQGILSTNNGDLVMLPASNITRIQPGENFRVTGGAGLDYMNFSHDGTDFNMAATQTTDLNITGIAAMNVGNYSFDVDQTVGAGQDNYVLTYDNGTGLISLEAAAGGSQTPWTSDIDGGGFGLDNIDRLEIQASGVATDTATFTHDGTDFNIAIANTADVNWTGWGSGHFKVAGTAAGGHIRQHNAADANEYIEMYHDTSLTAHLRANGGVLRLTSAVTGFNNEVQIAQGVDLVLQSSTNREMEMRNDGTDFIMDGGQGSGGSIVDVRFTGFTTNFDMGNFSFQANQTVGAGQDNYVLTYDDALGTIQLEPAGAGSQTPWTSDIDGGGFGLDNIDRLEIQDATAADTITFEHNGTLFSTTCVGTGDWKVYGLTGAFEVNQQANATSTIRIGDSATARGNSQNARLDMYGELSSTLYLTRIENTGAFFNFGLATGQAVNWTGDGDWTFDLHDGANLTLYDSTDTDSASFQHDGTNFNTAFTNTTTWDISGSTYIDVTGGTDLRLRDNCTLEIYDATDTNYAQMYVDGTSPNRIFSINTVNVDFLDYLNVGTAVRYRDGVQWEIYDPTDNSYLYINHDGTDVNWVGVNTTDFILDGLTWFKFLGGSGFALYDSTNADEMNMKHDGTDFNTAFVGTTDWNVKGLYGGATENDHQIHMSIHKYKDAALSRNTTTTLADDDDLFGIVLDADCVYSIDFYLVVNSTSATPDFKMAFQLSQTAQDGQWGARVSGAGSSADIYAATLTTATTAQIGASQEAIIIGRGMIHTHATLSTTMDLQWAQNTSDATNVTLELGSWLRVTKMGVA